MRWWWWRDAKRVHSQWVIGGVDKYGRPTNAYNGGFTTVAVYDRQLRGMGDEVIQFLRKAYEPPTLFARSGTLRPLVEDNHIYDGARN